MTPSVPAPPLAGYDKHTEIPRCRGIRDDGVVCEEM